MKWISKVLKWPVLYLWDKYELDPPLALVLFVLLGVVLSPISAWITVVVWGYVLVCVIWAIIEGISDDNN